MKSQMANEESEVLLHTRVDDLNDDGNLKKKEIRNLTSWGCLSAGCRQ